MAGQSSSDSIVVAFQKYVEKLQTGDILLPSRKSQKNAGSNKRRDSKVSVPEVLLSGKVRDEEIKLRLQQGQSFLDMEPSLQKSAEFIAREADRFLGKDEVENMLRQRKKGQWSSDEIQQLAAMRQQNLPLKTITKLLRRTTPSVKRTLSELSSTLSGPGAVEGPQEMPPGLQESLFNARLAEIWQVLRKSDIAQTWTEALEEKQFKEWLSRISTGIPDGVKKVLGGLRPPTWEEILSLPLIDTNDAGVYARLATSRHGSQMASDRYLYVGSASRYGGGLNSRIAEHTRPTKLKYQSRVQLDIKKKNLKGKGRFVTLMVMKMESSEYEVVLDARRTVTLAEAILTVWLAALQSPSHNLQCACPWDSQTLQQSGWSSFNPLLADVVLPTKSKTSGRQGWSQDQSQNQSVRPITPTVRIQGARTGSMATL
jgi:hypothetical protein